MKDRDEERAGTLQQVLSPVQLPLKPPLASPKHQCRQGLWVSGWGWCPQWAGVAAVPVPLPSREPPLGAGRERRSHWGSAPLLMLRCQHRSHWHHLSAGRIVPFLPGWFLSAHPAQAVGWGHPACSSTSGPCRVEGRPPLGDGAFQVPLGSAPLSGCAAADPSGAQDEMKGPAGITAGWPPALLSLRGPLHGGKVA